MSGETVLAIIGAAIIVLTLIVAVIKKLPKKLKQDKFINEWKSLQKNCKSPETWPIAVMEADKLLGKALRLRRFKGRSIGEKMVAAQDIFSNNDGVWFAHNLFKKIDTDPEMELTESATKKSLAEYRQALRDLGALPK